MKPKTKRTSGLAGQKLTHVDSTGRAVMVDVSVKPTQRRIARAGGHIRLLPATLRLIRRNEVAKGDVLTVAEVAGIQAAKRTAELIPLCHPLLTGKIDVKATRVHDGVRVESTVVTVGQTGAEMEALVAVSVALLTVYDMCKAVDKQMHIGNIALIEKRKEYLATI